MSILASFYEFEQGGLYSNYTRYSFFASRAKWLNQNTSGRILIVGCGWGYLVDELEKLNRYSMGVDASEYAIRRGHHEFPYLSSRLKIGDGRDASGLRRFGKFDVVVTEDLLTVCDSMAEAMRIVGACRSISDRVVHIVSVPTEGSSDPRLIWRSDWASVLHPDEVLDSQARGL